MKTFCLQQSLLLLLSLLSFTNLLTSVTRAAMTVPATTTTTTQDNHSIIWKALQKRFPDVSDYEILATIEQASAVGYKLSLSRSSSSSKNNNNNKNDETANTNTNTNANANTNTKVFLKQVVAGRYVSTKKDWPDLRRALLYARTEARFYDEFAPLLWAPKRCNDFAALPHVHMAEYDLQDWIDEDETGHLHEADPSVVKEDLPDAMAKGGTLLLECISDEDYFQDSPLTIPQCQIALQTVAQLHAAAWQDVKLLEKAEQRLSRCSFHLSMRNPKELAGIVGAWDHFATEFGPDLVAAGVPVSSPSSSHLGQRVAAVAEYVSEQVSVQQATDPFATLVHGDYKSMNVFLPKDNQAKNKSGILVDFASVGVGLGVSDVAMHVHHAIVPEQLDTNGGEEALVRHYWQTIQDCLAQRGEEGKAAAKAYTWEVALRQYRFAVVDYFRFFLGRFWKVSTHASMEKLADNKNTNLINRSVPAAVAFVARVHKYLSIVEEEFQQTAQQKEEL